MGIKLNDVINVLSIVVPNAREIINFSLIKEVNTPPEPPFEQDILTVSINTFNIYDSKELEKIISTLRYCGLTDMIKMGYTDKLTTSLDIIIDVTNLNVYYEYDFFNEAGGLRKLSIK